MPKIGRVAPVISEGSAGSAFWSRKSFRFLPSKLEKKLHTLSRLSQAFSSIKGPRQEVALITLVL